MKKELTIGIEGAVVNNGNLGCVALTYSLLDMLEKISIELSIPFRYYIFEGPKADQKIDVLCRSLKIQRDKIRSVPTYQLYRVVSAIHHLISTNKCICDMRKCDVIIDLTAGDSFTDIYGKHRFNGATNIKLLIEHMGIPLILGPQTYGPFSKKKNEKKAGRAIDGATCVIARDQLSADCVARFSSVPVSVTTDLAFGLPFRKKIGDNNGKIKIGINVSSLLVKNKTENTETNFKLKTDYDDYLKSILLLITADEKYDVHVIPHVGRDGGDELKDEFPTLKYLEPFGDPISAKNYISQMDIFIGARMHATIAAFSSGVATIPVAYSRKFKGLYESIGYNYIIDLVSLDTREAVSTTMEYIKYYKDLKAVAMNCLATVDEKTKLSQRLISNELNKIISGLYRSNNYTADS